MRQEALTTIKAGLSRQRLKGAALKDSLFDLLNGYVTTEKTIRSRPGTARQVALPSGTKGLTFFDGKFHVFAHQSVSGIPAGYELNIVRSPDGDFALSRIHFAEPFLGRLYVAAEFEDGNIYHYWLRETSTWEGTTQYSLSSAVVPTVANGFVYTPSRANPAYPQWSAGIARQVGDRVEPTTYLGYYFEVVSVSGSAPRSAIVEPGWINDPDIAAGKQYVESVDGTFETPTPTPPLPPVTPPPGSDRYGDDRPDSGGSEPLRITP